MPQTIKLADYLFTRLKQLGVGAVHGVPGDYNLALLDYVEPSNLLWVGNTNELNAGYAADGYARIKGVGALITTYGVGELSAINAIACAYTERAAVVHIVGTPPRNSQDSRVMVHHTLGDGDYRHFAQMATHVTVAQTNLLDPQTAGEQIDWALTQCVRHSRPVYIEVPVDLIAVELAADRLKSKLGISKSVLQPSFEKALNTILDRIYAAKQPVILVDFETRALGIAEDVQKLVSVSKWPTFTTAPGSGLIDSTDLNVHGIYTGAYGDSRAKTFVDGSDLVLCFGPHHSATNTYLFSSLPPSKTSISFTWAGIRIGDETYRDIPVKEFMQQLLQKLDQSRVKDCTLELQQALSVTFSDVSPDDLIKQDKAWRLMGSFLRPGDILFGETGTAAYGIREMSLPKHATLFTSITWLSIGYMLPASQGAALAQRELASSSKYHGISKPRTILVIGDGSFQMTVQELATIIRHNLDVVVFLINNDGYTIERCIHGMNQGYNDISTWRYLKAPGLFGAPEDSFTASAKTYGELEVVLKDPKLTDGTGLRMVEVFMDRNDAPKGPLLDLLNKQR